MTRAVLRGQPAGGFAYLATMVRGARKEAPGRVLLLDGGDIFQGTPIGNETRGDAVVECMRSIGYHAAALGNHEFDFGIPNMLRLVKSARFPVLAANMSGEVGDVKPYVVITPPNLKCRVAIIGLIARDTPQITSPAVGRTYRFADPVATAKKLVTEIDADLFVIVSHCGRDVELALAKAIPKLAVVLGGHSHTPVTQKIGNVTVLQTHAKTLSLGRVDLTLDPDGWKILKSSAKLLPVDPATTPADPRVQTIIDKHGKALSEKLKRVIGVLTEPARRRRGKSSSSAGNWMADVVRAVGKAEVGFTNKGGLRADIEAGKVTLADIYRLMPFENSVVTMLLKGSDIRALIQQHMSGRHGLEWSGMRVDLDERGAPEIQIDGKPLRDGSLYRVATNSFLSWGGDGFGAFADGTSRRSTGVKLRDAMVADLAKRTPFTPPKAPRFSAERALR